MLLQAHAESQGECLVLQTGRWSQPGLCVIDGALAVMDILVVTVMDVHAQVIA